MSHNLPIQLSRFIGRQREMVELRRLLAGTRLLTLTGPGGSGKTRLAIEVARQVEAVYEEGVGLAYRAAKAAAVTAIFEGISAEAFKSYYYPICRATLTDNQFGKVIFMVTHLIQRMRFLTQAVLWMAAREQRQGIPPRMSGVLWDTFTGSASYKNILIRTLQPAFIGRLPGELGRALIKKSCPCGKG